MGAKNSALQDAVLRLTPQAAPFEGFKSKPKVGAKRGEKSTGRPAAVNWITLEETDVTKRTYYAARTLTSSDGLFTIEWAPIKSMELMGRQTFTLKDPPP